MMLNQGLRMMMMGGKGVIYKNTFQYAYYYKSSPPAGYEAVQYLVSVPANTYSSTVSVADANAQANAYISANGQSLANANGTYRPIFTGGVNCNGFKWNTENACDVSPIGSLEIQFYCPSGNRWYCYLDDITNFQVTGSDFYGSNGASSCSISPRDNNLSGIQWNTTLHVLLDRGDGVMVERYNTPIYQNTI